MIAALMTMAVPTAQPKEARFGSLAKRLDYEVKATGLAPVFPEGYACEPIASGWGSPGRFDNSARLQIRNGGLHGGLDSSLWENSASRNGKALPRQRGRK